VSDLTKLFDTLLRATFAKLDKNKNAKVDVSELVGCLLAAVSFAQPRWLPCRCLP
jgi:hypothetical protein